jgi:hypothetical protein
VVEFENVAMSTYVPLLFRLKRSLTSTDPSENVYGNELPFTVCSEYVPVTEPLGDVESLLHAASATSPAAKKTNFRMRGFLLRLMRAALPFVLHFQEPYRRVAASRGRLAGPAC